MAAPLTPMAGTASQVRPASSKPLQPKISHTSSTRFTALPMMPAYMGILTSRRPWKKPIMAKMSWVKTALMLRHLM